MYSVKEIYIWLVITTFSLLSCVHMQAVMPTYIHNNIDMGLQVNMMNTHSKDIPPEDLFYLDKIADVLHSGMTRALASNLAEGIINQTEADIFPCLNDTEMLIEDLLLRRQSYAFQFIDADAKLPAGLLQGHWIWTGDYQQCNAIESPFNKFTNHQFKGKYSSVFLFRNGKPLMLGVYPLVVGVCLPDSCDIAAVKVLSEIAISPLSRENVTVLMVTQDDNPPYSAGAIAYFVISGLLVLLVALGTGTDVFVAHSKQTYNVLDTDVNNTDNSQEIALEHIVNRHVQDGKWRRIGTVILEFLIAFSFLSNTKKLLNTSTAIGPLACLNGLRVISMWWVIQGHSYGFAGAFFDNPVYALSTLYSRFTFQAIANGTFSVDTFFFLSGLLVAYLALKQWHEKGRINWVYYFGHRYWRLTPMYAFVLMFMATMVAHATSGPFQWFGTNPKGAVYDATHLCQTDWWANLLYINNMYPNYGSNTCMPWSWYLANDMQFYVVLSPIIVIALYKLRPVGWLVSGLLIVGCVASRITVVLYFGIHGENGPITKHMHNKWAQNGPMYVHAYARYSVYIVGMLTGHILQTNNCRIHLNKLIVLIGWIIAIATGLSVVYGLNHYSNPMDQDMSMAASVFYNGFNRTAWSLSLAWLTIACATGYGGWINSILSWKIWAPLGRLTYAAYLVHPVVIYCTYLNSTTNFHYTDLFLVSTFISNLVLSYGFAYIVSMAVEAPMMQLEKLILKKTGKRN